MVSLQKKLSDNHRKASKILAMALHAESSDVWVDTPIVWRARLTETEIASLAYSALRALDAEHRIMVFETVRGHIQMPIVPLLSEMDEVAHWADFADYSTVKACTLAGFNRLNQSDQSAFLGYVFERAAA